MKINKNHQAIIDHIAMVLEINISDRSEPIKRNAIRVDMSSAGRNEERQFEMVANSYKKIRIEPCGYKAIAIWLL